jgi:hypothetical protein
MELLPDMVMMNYDDDDDDGKEVRLSESLRGKEQYR